ncbi:MAG TPA: adenylate/guanylate cyclase domain-containing protein [Burkholderiales bacterium]|nr:adenylate/guanylate cyclase domain-containing protein [Burkholderiales bacterium]
MRATTPTQNAVAEREQALILLAELRNFTRMSEMLEPQQVLQLASEFFTLAGRQVNGHGGEVFGMHNDALLAVFRHASAASQAEQGVKAAHEITVEFAALAESWQARFGLRSAVAVALHLGETVFGVCGPQGSEQQVAFGDSLSVADRLVHRARAGEFVFSDVVMATLAGSELDLDPEPLPALELARRPPIKIYGVLLDTRLDFT